MSKYEPTIAEVLSDSKLIDKETAKLPTNPRRNAKGIVLRQRVGFSKGSYATLRNLKNFYKLLNEGKSPSHSLIISRAMGLGSREWSERFTLCGSTNPYSNFRKGWGVIKVKYVMELSFR